MTHETSVRRPRSVAIVGSAVARMVWSSTAGSIASTIAAKASVGAVALASARFGEVARGGAVALASARFGEVARGGAVALASARFGEVARGGAVASEAAEFVEG